ncbi:hypothetical protein D8Y20_09595 [Mariprofundus sp. EBB-1]|uniref:tetratricopeptide repeat protein n=1 Tax=Mariprofundus sp. EBB-1 TaxID=2650971 RepID=UPI000EF1DC5A|nr:tetratricopeptide repeat protein [Mariprofundus sp. EBB-1]RLL51330.1 hypothetical protein D8Y20_09595 [Mariprofundus sp. EBB-1]
MLKNKWLPITSMMFALIGFTSVVNGAETKSPWSTSYTLEANGEYEKAASVIYPFTDNSDENEFALIRYGWLNYLQGNFNDSIQSYQRALDRNNRSIDARLGIALPLMAQRRWSSAMNYLKQIIGLSPLNYTAHVRLMVCEEGLRNWETLEKHAKEVSANYPTDATAIVYLARAYAWQGKKIEAQEAYKRVLVRYPENLEAIRYLKS